MTLSMRKQSILAVTDIHSKAERGIMSMFETVLTEYWGIDRRSADNVEFFINVLKRKPRIQGAMVKLTRMYIPVRISKEGKDYKVVNQKKPSKKAQGQCLVKLSALIDMQLKSILHHPAFGTTGDSEGAIEFNWSKRQAGMKRSIQTAMDNGVSRDELIALIDNVIAGSTKPSDVIKAMPSAEELNAQREKDAIAALEAAIAEDDALVA